MRKKISDHIASVFPAVKEDLIKIEASISGEVTRLTRENGQLHRENATLIAAAGNANIMDEMRNFVADELKRAEATSRQDTEEVSRLKGVVNYLESQMDTVQVELQKAREEVVMAEQQLTDAKLAWEEEKVELRGSVELCKNVAADKDDTIRKLEKKIQKMDMEFEWVKGRSLEYYGSLQIANRDNQTLQGGIDELCTALDEMKAEMQMRAAEDIARDEAIAQTVQADLGQATRATSPTNL
jgi:chromosome segregation ATPase